MHGAALLLVGEPVSDSSVTDLSAGPLAHANIARMDTLPENTCLVRTSQALPQPRQRQLGEFLRRRLNRPELTVHFLAPAPTRPSAGQIRHP